MYWIINIFDRIMYSICNINTQSFANIFYVPSHFIHRRTTNCLDGGEARVRMEWITAGFTVRMLPSSATRTTLAACLDVSQRAGSTQHEKTKTYI